MTPKTICSFLLAILMLISTAAPAFADVFAFVTVDDTPAPVYVPGVLSQVYNGYEVYVNYGEDAQIPEGAQLEMYEYVEGTLQYDEYKEAAEAAVLAEEEQTVFARFFDITISYTDPATGETDKIEPAAPVGVEIVSPDTPTAERVSIVHFPDEEVVTESEMDKVVESAIEEDFASKGLMANGALKAEIPLEGGGREAERAVEGVVFDLRRQTSPWKLLT